MTRLISFVLALPSYEEREASEIQNENISSQTYYNSQSSSVY